MEESLNDEIGWFNKDHEMDVDSQYGRDKLYEVMKDATVCCNIIAEKESKCFEYCFKRKIIALTHMAS